MKKKFLFAMAIVFLIAAVTMAARYEVLPVYQLEVYKIKSLGQRYPEFDSSVALKGVSPSFTSGTGFSITATGGNVFYIDTTLDTAGEGASVGIAGAGVTVLLPTVTAAMDSQVLTFVKTDSGITPIILYASGLPIGNASGTTDNLLSDAQGDSITVVADYGSAVSYWILANYTH